MMAVETRPAPTGAGRGGRRWPVAVATAVAVAAGGGVVAAVWAGGGAAEEPLPGIAGPGPLTAWGLPLARTVGDVAAVATVGLLLAAVVLAPARPGRPVRLGPHGWWWLRGAGWAALAWAMASAATAVFTLSDLLGVPAGRVLRATSTYSFLTDLPQGRVLLLALVVAVAVATASRLVLTVRGGLVLLVAAMVAVVAPATTGHAASAGSHQLAVSALVLHVAAVTLWTGGLMALLVCRRLAVADLSRAVSRFSRLAVACLVVVAGSGTLSAAVRLPGLEALVSTGYGRLVMAKAVALLALGVLGWWQRRRCLPELAGGVAGAFRRIAAVEVGVFAATIGLAVGLSRTAPPVTGGSEDAATSLLGYPMPGPLTVRALVTDWLPEPITLTVAAAAVGFYLAGVLRLHRRGIRWPAGRTAAWLLGWAVVVLVTSGGLARYAPILFSAHMVQHMALTMVAPILLVLSGPITLALRALPASRDASWPGPREWILAGLHSRPARLLTHPVVALGLYTVGLYGMYLTGLYETALRSHTAHLLMIGHFLASGYLFFFVLIGTDPAPRRRPAYPLRLVVLLIFMGMHAIFGLILMLSQEIVAADWYAQLGRPWGDALLADQKAGGGIAWASGELPAVAVAIALAWQWARSDSRAAARYDRAVDRAEAAGEDNAHAAYNRYLADLAQRQEQAADHVHRR